MSLSPAFQELFENTKKEMKQPLKFISAGVLLTPVILGLVVFAFLKTQPPFKFGFEHVLPVIMNTFIALSALSLSGSIIICHKLFLNDKFIIKMLSREVKAENLASSKEGGLNTSLFEKLKQLDQLELKIFSLFTGYPGWFFLGHTLAESSAIFGFILTFVTGNFNTYLYFAGPSIAVMVYNIIRIDELIEKIDIKLRN